MAGERRTKSFKPLQINVLNASQMIIPPLAGELNSATVDEWVTLTAYAYGDIVRSGTRYYWCTTAGGGNSGAVVPVHTDGDASDGTLTWRYVRWHRDVLSLTNVAGAGTISIARGVAAEINKGITLFTNGALNEGFDNELRPYAGAWYAISDDAGGRMLAISEG